MVTIQLTSFGVSSIIYTVQLASLIITLVHTLQLGEPVVFSNIQYYTAFHIEQDESKPSELLAGFVASCGVIRDRKSAPDIIAGSGRAGFVNGFGTDARFNIISGFRQINLTHILAVDRHNHCLRLINRESKEVTTAAGRCGDFGYSNGQSQTAQFYRPYNIIDGDNFQEGSHFVTDNFNSAIRLINLDQGTVTTFKKDEKDLYSPIGLAYDSENHRVYVTLRFKTVYIDLDTKTVTILSLDNWGDKILLYTASVLLCTQNPDDGQAIWQIHQANNSQNHSESQWTFTNLTFRGSNDELYAMSLDYNRTLLYLGDRRRIYSVPTAGYLNVGIYIGGDSLQIKGTPATTVPVSWTTRPASISQASLQTFTTYRSMPASTESATPTDRDETRLDKEMGESSDMIFASVAVSGLLLMVVIIVVCSIKIRKLRIHRCKREDQASNENNANETYEQLNACNSNRQVYAVIQDRRPSISISAVVGGDDNADNPYMDMEEVQRAQIDTERASLLTKTFITQPEDGDDFSLEAEGTYLYGTPNINANMAVDSHHADTQQTYSVAFEAVV